MPRATTLLLLVCLLAPSPHADAALRWQDAESWVERALVPAVMRQLTEQPRFRGETIRIVAFENGAPAARSSRFALELRDRLSAALLDVPGIRIAAAPGAGSRLDCTRNDVDYFLGLQVTRIGRANVRVTLRTLDVANNTWVTGHDTHWQGALTARQRAALDQPGFDSYFQGRRAAPFDDAQPDVLARKLAHELACASARQLGGEYVVFVDPGEDGDTGVITELIANNLALLGAVRFTRDPDRANAVLRGKVLAVDRELGQFWASLAPTEPAGSLAALTASVYVRQPPVAATRKREPDPLVQATPDPVRLPRPVPDVVATTAPPAPVVTLPSTRNAVLTHASLVPARGRTACRGRGRRCTALQLQSRDTAAVFLLNHQPRHGLVRITGDRCNERAAPSVLTGGTRMTLALHAASRDGLSAVSATSIAVRPVSETWYALGIANSRAALDFSRHLRALPPRCTAAARSGLRGDALEAWLGEFAVLLDRWRNHVDLRAVHAGVGSPGG